MAFSYDPSLTRPLDRLRFQLADTTEAGAYFQDGELIYLLEENGQGVYAAAAQAARQLVARFSRMVGISTGGLTINVAERVGHFSALASAMDEKARGAAARTLGGAFVGGLSISAINAAQGDTDRPPNRFVMGSDDGTGPDFPREASRG